MDLTIACVDVTKSYRGMRVLDGVSIEIGAGICGLMGPNGAGKSTLLKVLTGLIAPDCGEVFVAGVRLATSGVEFRRQIGVLPEDLGVIEDLTILEHLLLVGPIYGLTVNETAARSHELLGLLALSHAANTRLRECSFGMRKKTALALALLHRPRVLVLDEPFEGVDASSVHVIEHLLRSYALAGGTVLLTSHILPLLQRLADRVVLLRNGSVAWDSSAAEQHDSLEKVYFERVGSPVVETPAWF